MRKMLGKRKGMSTILAALLLVVIIVVSGSMVYAWATGLFGGMMGAAPSIREALSMDTFTVASGGTSADLYIRNIGTVDILYVSAIVEYGGKMLGSPATCSTPIIVGGGAVKVTVTPSTPFFPGRSYTVRLITDKGNQFTFQILG